MPPANWMNDPNGPIYINDEYHLFYQYNPNGDNWGSIHWGHAKSRDMVYWDHLPIALAPSLEKNEQHCFSGCTVVDDNGEPTIFYTSVGVGERNHTIGSEQWMAKGTSDLITWSKHRDNPIMTLDIHGDVQVREWRDPFVWKEADTWYMVLSGSCQGHGCVLIYRSSDLMQWEFLNILDQGKEGVWECPNFFALEDKYVLLYSPDLENDYRVRYKIGTLQDNFRFQSEFEGILDYGGREGYYAPTSFLDGQERRILLSWMPETARGDFKGIKGWSGVHTIPRVLSLRNNRLNIEPIPEMNILRENERSIGFQAVEGVFDTGVKGKALEVKLITEQAEEPFCMKFYRSPDGEEETVLWIDPKVEKVILDRSKSSLYSGTHSSAIEGKLTNTTQGQYRVHIFLDYSTIEVFINEETCLSARVYPKREDSMDVQIYSETKLLIHTLQAWNLISIS